MFRGLRIFYYNNKVRIWIVVGVIIFVYLILRIINFNIKNESEKEMEEQNNINEVNTISEDNETEQLPSDDTTVMSGDNLPEESIKEDNELINKFVELCNNRDLESAYNMISSDCKNEMFKTIDEFSEYYVDLIFNENKSYSIETWSDTNSGITYRIKYIPNLMSAGKVNDVFTEDFITVITENNEKKFNINKFIQKQEINNEVEQDNLDIKVTNKYEYYNYEQYELTFKNNGQIPITIDTKNDTKSIYVVDNNGTTYTWFGNEVPNNYLTLQSGEERTFRIKFNELYTSNKRDEKICFNDIHFGDSEESTYIEFNVKSK